MAFRVILADTYFRVCGHLQKEEWQAETLLAAVSHRLCQVYLLSQNSFIKKLNVSVFQLFD